MSAYSSRWISSASPLPRCIVLVAIGASGLAAQVGAPTLGYVPVGANVRQVVGIPAAARVTTETGFTTDLSVVAASAGYALGVTTTSGQVVLVGANGEQALTGIGAGGANTAPDVIVVSPTGSAAVVWFSSTGQGRVLTGLPNTADSRQIDVPFLTGLPISLAVSDDGAWVAGVWGAGAFALGPDSQVVELEVDAALIAFAKGSLNMIAASSTSLWRVGGPDAGFAATLLADLQVFQSEGSAQADNRQSRGGPSRIALAPAGVATTLDGLTALAALRNGRIVQVALDSSGSPGPVEVVADCHCTPTVLAPMSGGVFRLTEIDPGAMKLFEPDRARVLVVLDGGSK